MVDVPSATDLPSAFATSGLKVEPSSGRFATGYLASEQLPAEHFNYLLNRISTLGINSNTELISVIGELKTMLTAAGYSPDSGSVGQLKLALDKLYATSSNVSPNYISNATMEYGITGYATYNDGAVSVPVDGTGGTPTISISQNATTPIFGNYDLQITKPAANCQGQGISTDFTIDRGAVGQPLYIEFSYNTDSGFVNGDIGVYVDDRTNNNILYPSIVNLSSGSTTKYAASFIPSTSTSYRLIWHIQSTNAVAWNVHIDNVSISAQRILNGAAIGNWNSYTPSLPGDSTNFSASGFWRRNGSDMELQIHLTNSAASSGTAGLIASLPSGYSIDGSKCSVASVDASTFGEGWLYTGSGARSGINVNYYSSTSICLWRNSGDSARITGGLFVAPGAVFFYAKVPIAQWTSNINLASDFTEYASNSSTADADDTTSFYNGADGSSAMFTLTANRLRRVRFLRPIQATDTLTLEFYDSITGGWLSGPVIFLGGGGQSVTTNGSTGAALYYIAATLPKTDITVLFYQNRASGLNWSTNMTNLRWRVRKVSNGNMAEVPQNPFADYYTNSDITLGTSNTRLNISTKVKDTHSAITTGASWLWTCPVSGRYTINFDCKMAIGAATSNLYYIDVFINGISQWTTYGYSGLLAVSNGATLGLLFLHGTRDYLFNQGDTVYLTGYTSVNSTMNNARVQISRVSP